MVITVVASKKIRGGPAGEPKPRGKPPAPTKAPTMFESLFFRVFKNRTDVGIEDIRKDENVSSKICIRAYCFFICENDACDGKLWFSGRSWITVDLSQPGVLRRYRQKCSKCLQPSWPRVPMEQLEDFALTAIEIYIDRCCGRRREGPPAAGRRNTGRPPHKTELCEKCGYGKRDCGERRVPPKQAAVKK